jgi:hypothetical protein
MIQEQGKGQHIVFFRHGTERLLHAMVMPDVSDNTSKKAQKIVHKHRSCRDCLQESLARVKETAPGNYVSAGLAQHDFNDSAEAEKGRVQVMKVFVRVSCIEVIVKPGVAESVMPPPLCIYARCLLYHRFRR